LYVSSPLRHLQLVSSMQWRFVAERDDGWRGGRQQRHQQHHLASWCCCSITAPVSMRRHISTFGSTYCSLGRPWGLSTRSERRPDRCTAHLREYVADNEGCEVPFQSGTKQAICFRSCAAFWLALGVAGRTVRFPSTRAAAASAPHARLSPCCNRHSHALPPPFQDPPHTLTTRTRTHARAEASSTFRGAAQ
jgi:hypothetical protein